MSVEVTKGYANYPVKVVVVEGNTRYTITTQSVRFDQYDHGTPFLRVEHEQIKPSSRKPVEAYWHVGQARTDGINPYGTCMTCGHHGPLTKRGTLRRHKGAPLV